MQQQSNDEIMAALLGIPDIHVLSLEEGEAGLGVVVETNDESALCAACATPAVPSVRRSVEFDSAKPFFGRPLHLTWQARGWSCENPACQTGTFHEKADWRFSAA